MKKLRHVPILKIIPAFLLVVCFTGCVQDQVVISVNPDGTGTIEETITSNMFMEKVKKECEKDDCPTEDQVAAQLAEDTSQYARQNAELFGEGVTFVAVEPVHIDKVAGSKAIYRFNDINKIKINKDPMTRTGGPLFRGRSASDDEKITFFFKKGSPAELKVTMFPSEWMESQLNRKPEPQDDDDFIRNSEMNELMRSGKMYIGLHINGDIVRSNATYQTGRDIALIDILFQDLLDKHSVMNSLRTNPPKSVQEYRERIKGSKNFKLELTTPVVINFK